MIAVLLTACLHFGTPQQDTTALLTDRKWYRSYTIVREKTATTAQKSLYERPWIYFGKPGFFTDFKGPKQEWKGRWIYDARRQTVIITNRPGGQVEYRILQLKPDSLQLRASDGTVIGLLSGRTR